ncbi:MAG: hypothetical protein KBG55_07320 [Polaromonas sp.]|nr:hypothetical protein [Polaromonas sp.]
MALPWLIGGAVALGAAAIATALSDDDKPSNNNDDDDDGERRRRERAERERAERDRGEKRGLLVSSVNTQAEPTRLFRRQFILSHATLAGSSSWR